jgi:hypothetical protein
MSKLITRKILQSRITTILVVLFFTVGSSGCVTTLGYVPEQIKLRNMEDKNTFTPTYPEVKEWAYDVLDGYDSRATANRYALYGGALLGAVAVGAVAGLTAFDSGSSVIKGFAIGGPVLGSIFAIYSSEEKARIYRLASSSIKELITLSDKRLLRCQHSTSSSVQEADTMEKQAAGNLSQATRNRDATKQKKKILGEEIQKARENVDNASASEKPGLQEVASAIEQKLREARESVLVAEAELLGAEEDLKNAKRCSQVQARNEGKGPNQASNDDPLQEEALCLRTDVDGIMAKVEGHIAQLDPRNVTEQLKSVKANATKLNNAGGNDKEADTPIKAPTDDLSDISPPVKSSCGVF